MAEALHLDLGMGGGTARRQRGCGGGLGALCACLTTDSKVCGDGTAIQSRGGGSTGGVGVFVPVRTLPLTRTHAPRQNGMCWRSSGQGRKLPLCTYCIPWSPEGRGRVSTEGLPSVWARH